MDETPPEHLDIRLLPAAASRSGDVVRGVTELINRVYAVAEHGQWRTGTTRTTVEEITELIGAEEIVVACLGDDLVGALRVGRLDATTAEAGMLAVDPAHRGRGFGRDLRRFVLELLVGRGFTALQIELLAPRGWTQDSKTFMADWNHRGGFEVVRTGTLDEQYPDLAPLLATPCDFVILRKELR